MLISKWLSVVTIVIFFINNANSHQYKYKHRSNPGFTNPKSRVPQQIHLSLVTYWKSMSVSWITMAYTKTYVRFSRNKKNLNRQKIGFSSKFTDSRGVRRFAHTVQMKPLHLNRRYYYQVGSYAYGWSQIYSFKTLPEFTSYPLNICVVGDLGYENGVSINDIKLMVQQRKIDLIIHIGDIAYNLHNYGKMGNRGDNFMKKMEKAVASVPYMIIGGNHEDDNRNFSQLRYRFNMPDDPDRANQYYSFNYGPIHFVGVSTEYLSYYKKYGKGATDAQYEWLKKDLDKANKNREKIPWIIVFQHRPMYCTLGCHGHDNKIIMKGENGVKGLENLYITKKVDMVLTGHVHYYERFLPMAYGKPQISNFLYPYYKPTAPIYIVTGIGGCFAKLFYQKIDKIPAGSVVRIWKYGYTMLTVAMKNTIILSQINVDYNPRIVDYIEIVK